MIRYRRIRETYPHPDAYKDYWIEADGTVVGYVEADRPGRAGGTLARWMAYRLDGTRLCPTAGTFRRLKLEIGWALDKGAA
jgi:hypothetical protein